MLGNFLKLLDVFGLFNIICGYCNRSKGGQYWENDEFPGKKFCKKACLNNYFKEYGSTFCEMCGKGCGLNYLISNDENKNFCKQTCVDRYYRIEPCANCNLKHGMRTYKYKGNEFGSKMCKEHFINKKNMYNEN